MTLLQAIAVGNLAATLWALAAASTLLGRLKSQAIVSALVVDLVLFALAAPRAQYVILPTRPVSVALLVASSLAELASILVAVFLLRRARRTSLIAPVVAILVGLHFLLLCQATGLRLFLLLATLLVASGLLALRLGRSLQRPPTRNASLFLAAAGSALSFWIVNLAAMVQAQPSLPPGPL